MQATDNLSIGAYDCAEVQAIKRASYPAIRAFRPAAFSLANFPVRVTDECELIRYSDIMDELYDSQLYYRRLRYSREEAYLISSVSREVGILTQDLFGRAVQPFMCLFTPIAMLRAVMALGRGSPCTILEIGPGSGYLGAYLILAGYRYGSLRLEFQYRSTDNTQALYLWQDRFFRHLAGPSYMNYATAGRPPQTIPERVASLPWWQFAELFESPWPVDIVICDAAMGEMDPFAANYTIRLAAVMLKESHVGVFLFRHIGEQRINSMNYIDSRFVAAGFHKHQVGQVVVHSLRPLSLPDEFPPLGGHEEMRVAESFLPIDNSKLLDSYKFFDFIRLTS
jgi:hypothetical protein